MPIDLGKLRSKTASVVVTYGDETVNVTYYPQRVNPEYQTKVKRLMAKVAADDDVSDEAEQWASLLSVVYKWDIMDGGKELPVAADSLKELPTDLLGAIFQAILEHMRPNRTSAETSGAGSLAKVE